MAVFLLRQRALQERDVPLLDLRVLSHRTYAVGVTIQAVSFLAMMGAMILLPLYLQDLRGLSPLQTGLLVAPGGLAMGLLGPRVGKRLRQVRRPAAGDPRQHRRGRSASGVLSQVSATTPYALVLGAHVLLMVSLAALFTPVFTLSLGALPPHLYSHGSSLLGTTQQVVGRDRHRRLGDGAVLAHQRPARRGREPGCGVRRWRAVGLRCGRADRPRRGRPGADAAGAG